jgi:uncharacterized membrane protein
MSKPFCRCIVLLAICLYLTSFAATAMADTTSTSIKIQLQPNGDSIWTTEKRIPLETLADVAGWDATATNGTDSYKAAFESQMKSYVARISANAGRKMEVQDVNVTVEKSQPYTTSDNSSVTYGVIRYQFTWTNFAMLRDNILEVGDAFVDGLVLNKDDSIRIILPADYKILSVSPAYDDFNDKYEPEVVWYGDSVNSTDDGARLFASGEPSITIQQESGSLISFGWWMLIPAILLSALIGFGAAYMLFHKKESPYVLPATPEAVIELPETEVERQAWQPQQAGGERYMSDEEKIIKYLEESGGQMFQSDLVKKTDFSKSKLSMVLSELKEKGKIIKIKKGKENLIRLSEYEESKKNGQ